MSKHTAASKARHATSPNAQFEEAVEHYNNALDLKEADGRSRANK